MAQRRQDAKSGNDGRTGGQGARRRRSRFEAATVGVEGVAPCLDFAHLHARAGDGTMNSHAEWLAVLKRYRNGLGAASLAGGGIATDRRATDTSATQARRKLVASMYGLLCKQGDRERSTATSLGTIGPWTRD